MRNGVMSVFVWGFICMVLFGLIVVFWNFTLTSGEVNRSVELQATVQDEVRSIAIDELSKGINDNYRELSKIRVDINAVHNGIDTRIRDYLNQFRNEVTIDNLQVVVSGLEATVNLDYTYKTLIKGQGIAAASGGDSSAIPLHAEAKVRINEATVGNGSSDKRDNFNINQETQVLADETVDTNGGRTFQY